MKASFQIKEIMMKKELY